MNNWPGTSGLPFLNETALSSTFTNQYRWLRQNVLLRLDSLESFVGMYGGGQTAVLQEQTQLSGIVPTFQGGTGLDHIGSADQVLAVKHDGSGLQYKNVLGTAGQIVIVGADGTLAVSLATVGTPGSFGSSSQVPVLTTDAYGRVTFVALATVSGTSPGGAAGGDLAGTYPNPTVAKINGNSVPSGVALGDLLYGSGASALARLAGNTSGSRRFLRQTGTGTVSAAPVWDSVTAADLPSSGVHSGDAIGTFPAVTMVHSAVWTSAAAYNQWDIVRGSDGHYYIATAGSNTNHDPTGDSGACWALYYVTSNLVLTVQTVGGRFNSLQTGTNPVWAFIQYATIPQGANLTVQVTDGTYAFTAQQVLVHPFGLRILLVGNTTTPANCILQFGSGTNGINLTNGIGLALIDGFTIDGVNKTGGTTGLNLGNLSRLTVGGKIVIKNFDTGIGANNAASLVNFAGGLTVTLCNTGVFLQQFAHASTTGFVVSNCTIGISVTQAASAYLQSPTMSNNTTHFSADHGAFMSVLSPSFSGGGVQYSPVAGSVGNNNAFIANS